MQIKNLTLVNFMGIKGTASYTLPQLAALVGPNGIGKTTLLNGLRFALTGVEPDGEIINTEAKAGGATITLVDPADGEEYVFERRKTEGKPSKALINGKATTQKAMNDKIETIIGIPLDKVKIISSADVVAAMKPDEFSSFILDYIPEKVGIEKVISLVPDATIGMLETLDANLPETGIELSDLDAFDEMCRYTRKELKDQLTRKQALYETLPQEAPGFDKESVAKEMEALQEQEAGMRVYRTRVDAYQKAVMAAKRHEQMVTDLTKEVAAITANRPDSAVLSKLQARRKSVQETLQNQKVSMRGAQSAMKQMEITLEALEKPICPISPLITCHENKSVAQEEIKESIAATRDGIAAMEKEVEKATKELTDIEGEIEKENRNGSLYEKKIALQKQLMTLSSSKPEIPEKPEELEVVDFTATKKLLKDKLSIIEKYEEGLQIKAQIERLTIQVSDFEKLVKAMAEKGPVRTGIVSSYLSVFEEICNTRAAVTRPDIHFTFVSDNGVKVYMDTGNGPLAYASLSGGEKAYMLFILLDMLNSLTGTKLMLLDELSVIDEGCFDSLLDTVLAYKGEYDHILLSAVDHEDTVRSIDKRGIPKLTRDTDTDTASTGEEITMLEILAA